LPTQLEANIAIKGVRQNLIGVPVARKRGHYRIIAGGRRLDAVHRLIEKGIFGADYQVAVLVLDNAKEAIETSLEENFFNLTMNPADTCRAFQDIVENEGKTPEDVAIRFGLTERFVRGRLALADLADCVFDALRNGEVSLTVATAYASGSSDRDRQAEVYELLRGSYQRGNVDEIRRQLAQGTYTGSDPKAQLVGREDYMAAGGRFHGDLFTDQATERWIDGGLLDTLAAEKLAAAAEAVREREGFHEVRVLPKTYVGYNDTWDLRPVKGEPPALTSEQEERLQALEAEIEALDTEVDGLDDEAAATVRARGEALDAEYEAIINRHPVLSDEQKASVLAYLVIGDDGRPRLHEQLYVAPSEDPEPDDEDGGDGKDGDTDVKGNQSVYSQRLSQELAEMKTELLRVHVASDPAFALDLATFWMVDRATRQYPSFDLATELRADAPYSPLPGYESGTLAAEEWDKLGEALDRGWTGLPDVRDRYDAFCALAQEARVAWLAWTVARTLKAVPAGKVGSAFLDHLGVKLEIDVAAWWRPTANNYFDRLSSKGAILGHLEALGGAELASRYGASKKHELATSAEKIFAGNIPIEAELRDAAMAWVPDVMRFQRAPDETPAASDNDVLTDADELSAASVAGAAATDGTRLDQREEEEAPGTLRQAA
jgi:ParB family chromosome partitioning protein